MHTYALSFSLSQDTHTNAQIHIYPRAITKNIFLARYVEMQKEKKRERGGGGGGGEHVINCWQITFISGRL